MPNTATLLEQRANVWDQMKAIMEEADKAGRDLTAEETQKYDRAESDLDSIEDRIARQEKYDARNKELSPVVDRGELKGGGQGREAERDEQGDAYKTAFDAWFAQGSADMPSDQRKILRDGFVDGKDIKAAAGVGSGSAGGYTVPPEYRAQIVERMKMVSSVRSVAETITTDTGANLPWPTADDSGNVGAILSENTQITEQDFTFGTASIDAYMYTSKLVRVSLQLINDSAFAVDSWIGKRLGTRIARIQNQHFTTGTGSSQPDGVVPGATVGKVGAAGQLTSVIYDDLVDLIDALDPAYLDGGNLQWMMPQTMRKGIRKIKDGQNRPLWEPSVQVAVPDTLLGYAIKLNNDMPSPGASAKSLLFGNFEESYLVRDVNEMFLVRFTERYMDYLQVAFAAFMRTDGTVQNTYSYTAFQHAAA